jgi:putative nucleotidyltransferase with HDIG domain
VAAAVLFVAAAAGAVALAGSARWDPVLLPLMLALAIGAGLRPITLGLRGSQVTGEALGLVGAMALLGPAPAALVGASFSVVWCLSAPTRLPFALSNLAERTATGLLGGLAMAEVAQALDTRPAEMSFVLPVLAAFAVLLLLNALITNVVMVVIDGDDYREVVRTVLVRMLPSHLTVALLCTVAIVAEANFGVLALAMLVALFFLYLYLLHELVVSQQRGQELTARTEQLASLQVGVLTAMLRTLSMRDQMTARHSAAVARYAREIARAAGCTEEEQDLVHTAGLLHDIGKFILPDHILLADTKLDDEDWQLIRKHPYQGAKVVREMEGYGPVADIILCHHERIDGRGYPRGLRGDDIPLYSRMLSIADTYDVMTSRDSYRVPVSSEEAIAELRRVSGAQLDGRLVELFIGVLEREGVAFRHGDDADFEAELAFESRVRDHAAPRPALPAAA